MPGEMRAALLGQDMAIQVMTDVWQYSQATGTRLLVLLALADAADRETREAYPGLNRIAQYARIKPRQVFAHINALIGMGELRRIEGGHSGRRAVYQVLVNAEKGAGNNILKGAEDNTLSTKKGAVRCRKRVQSGVKKGAVATAPLPLEPTDEPTTTTSCAREKLHQQLTLEGQGALDRLIKANAQPEALVGECTMILAGERRIKPRPTPEGLSLALCDLRTNNQRPTARSLRTYTADAMRQLTEGISTSRAGTTENAWDKAIADAKKREDADANRE